MRHDYVNEKLIAVTLCCTGTPPLFPQPPLLFHCGDQEPLEGVPVPSSTTACRIQSLFFHTYPFTASSGTGTMPMSVS